MKRLQFEEKSAQKISDSYVRRVKRMTKILSKEDQKEILMEINSHIHEGMMVNKNKMKEVQSILEITNRLGDPEVVLKPLVASKKLNQATSTFNPKHVFQALFLNIKNGFVYALFGVLYLSIFSSGLLLIMKLIRPESTGLFLKDGEFHALGSVDSEAGLTEVLGGSFLPVVIVSAILLYLFLTLILRLLRK